MSSIVNKNDVLNINTNDSIGIHITSHGSDWLWAVFSIFVLFLLVHGFFALYHEKKQSWFKHYLFIGAFIPSFTLAFAYFTLASDLGWTGIPVEFNHIDIGDDTRQIFYARFVGWFCAWPGLLFLYELNSQAQNGLSTYDLSPLIKNVVIQTIAWETYVISFLVGALVSSTYKWGYWTFGTVALLFGLYRLVERQLFGSLAVKSRLTKLTLVFLFITCILYPVSWGLSEGGNVIQPDSETVFYGILDLINFWIIPVVLIYDAITNGVAQESHPTQDVEKTADPATEEPKVSGETA